MSMSIPTPPDDPRRKRFRFGMLGPIEPIDSNAFGSWHRGVFGFSINIRKSSANHRWFWSVEGIDWDDKPIYYMTSYSRVRENGYKDWPEFFDTAEEARQDFIQFFGRILFDTSELPLLGAKLWFENHGWSLSHPAEADNDPRHQR